MTLQPVTEELNVEKMYKKVEKLVSFAANKYCADGHPILNREDLVATGWEVFARVLHKNPNVNEAQFLHIFKTSLFNQLITIVEKYRYSKKRGYNGEDHQRNYEEKYIDLTEIADLVGREQILELYYTEYVAHVEAILIQYPDALLLFQELINPSDKVYEYVLEQNKRKQYLKQNGLIVRGVNVVAVKKQHIQKVLGWSVDRFADALGIVKKIVLQVINQQEGEFAV